MIDAVENTVAPYVATPVEELTALVTCATGVFYWAEQGVNPAVKTYWDALHYVATSLSVGYANIFPVTAVGKAVGAVVMMVGPALSARALDTADRREPANEPAIATPAALAALTGKLDAILEELKKQTAAR